MVIIGGHLGGGVAAVTAFAAAMVIFALVNACSHRRCRRSSMTSPRPRRSAVTTGWASLPSPPASSSAPAARSPPSPDWPTGPGDHFGELAARDWGGVYGYARLATVRCAEPGQLLRLTSDDLQWLVDSEPAVKVRLEATLAERLQNR